ncbi:hypothetical protein M378DRAFT_749141 [Amanita muscaria Koide BX008]|uniref:Uncharacterized protein n=1 Tax=Amanita muscaria (strain Koide BX008) TaxID=946122 RepID=A0A0C2SHV0_AMAMK|nr:hypothetical protein M378DRAFT_749141 [Amanita muscaria Koide BX008]
MYLLFLRTYLISKGRRYRLVPQLFLPAVCSFVKSFQRSGPIGSLTRPFSKHVKRNSPPLLFKDDRTA